MTIPSLDWLDEEILELEEPTSLVELIKASFGGDRSEAGRYAANIRWQGSRAGREGSKSRDITKELGGFFGRDIAEFRESEGFKEIKKRDEKNKTGYYPDYTLEIIADKQGFSDLPKVVSSEEMTRLEKEGWTIAYRGIASITITTPNKTTNLNAEDLAEEFRTGKYFAGHGVHGNGTYFSTDLETAEYFAQSAGGKKGAVIKVAIPPDALMERSEFVGEIIKHRDSSLKNSREFRGDDDIGRVLAARGVRGAKLNVRVSGSFSAVVGEAIESNVIVIWDRSMLAVEESEQTK